MNRFILFTGFLFCFSFGYSQEVLDTITRETCDCIAAKGIGNLSPENLNLELGFCIIESLNRHENASKELNINIYDADGMRQLGEKIGMRMAVTCPDIIFKIAALNESPESSGAQVEGVITGIEGNEFGFVLLRDDEGRVQKLLWLRYFQHSEQLINDAKGVIGKRVRITYEPLECYSPRERDYFERKEIRAIEFLK